MTLDWHHLTVTAHDGEGVGLECSCGWTWTSSFVVESFGALSEVARAHLHRARR